MNARSYTYTYEYPKSENINLSQKNYLKNFMLTFENNLNSYYFDNYLIGYLQYIDIESFIDFQIINELGNNVDGYRYSTFFHKQRDSEGGKLIAGPLWDFDISYGNLNYSARNLATNQWNYLNYGSTEWNCMHWWARFMQDPNYVEKLKMRWTQLRKSSFHTDSIMNWVDAQVAYLGDAVTRNFSQWNILGTYVWPNYYIGYTHDSEVNYLKNWIRNRLDWMDSQLLLKTGSDKTNQVAIKLYPNPVSEKLFIEYKGNSLLDIGLYNLTGSLVLQRISSPSENLTELNISQLHTGFYIIKIKDGTKVLYSERILKK